MLREAIKHLLPPSLLVRRLDRELRNAVLLTFDDGPRPGVTEEVLRRLDRHQARAVFFVVGRHAAEFPALLRQILEQGHVIGNHSLTHALPPPRNLGGYRREVAGCQEVIRTHAGTTPRLFRAPTGKITVASLLAPRLLGMRSVLWSRDSGDWSCQTRDEAERIAVTLRETARAGDILLLHDFSPHVLTILDLLLPGLRSRGFDLQTAAGWLEAL